MEQKEKIDEIPNPNEPEDRQKLGSVKICPKALYKAEYEECSELLAIFTSIGTK